MQFCAEKQPGLYKDDNVICSRHKSTYFDRSPSVPTVTILWFDNNKQQEQCERKFNESLLLQVLCRGHEVGSDSMQCTFKQNKDQMPWIEMPESSCQICDNLEHRLKLDGGTKEFDSPAGLRSVKGKNQCYKEIECRQQLLVLILCGVTY